MRNEKEAALLKTKQREVAVKMEIICAAIKRELKKLEPSAKLKSGFKPTVPHSYGDKAYFSLLDTTVEVMFKSEWTSEYYSKPSGKIRITVGDWQNSKRFNQPKKGHNHQVIAETIVAFAKRIVENLKKDADRLTNYISLKKIAAEINKKHGIAMAAEGFEVVGTPRVEVMSDGRLVMDMPYVLNPDQADRLLGFMKNELGL